jgi:hypothetical protein
MSDSIIVILVFIDVVAGFLIWLYLNDRFNQISWWKAAVIKSLVYGLFFGIGALGEGGGEPGFLLPAPVLLAAIVSLTEQKWHLFVDNAFFLMGFG